MIEFRSKFDANITKPLLKQQMKKMWWIFVLFTLLISGMGVMTILAPEPDVVFGISLIAVGVLFLPIVYVLSLFIQKRYNKTMSMMSGDTYNYFRFEQDKIYQETMRGEVFKSTFESDYSVIYRIHETKTHFFMFISNMQAHVLPKKDIISGNAEELSSIFSSKLGKKFKKSK